MIKTKNLHLFYAICLTLSPHYIHNHVSPIKFRLFMILDTFHNSYYISTIISWHSPICKSFLHGLTSLIPHSPLSFISPLSQDANFFIPSFLVGAIARKHYLCFKGPGLKISSHHKSYRDRSRKVSTMCSPFQLLDQELDILNILLHSPALTPRPIWNQKPSLKVSLCLTTKEAWKLLAKLRVETSKVSHALAGCFDY